MGLVRWELRVEEVVDEDGDEWEGHYLYGEFVERGVSK